MVREKRISSQSRIPIKAEQVHNYPLSLQATTLSLSFLILYHSLQSNPPKDIDSSIEESQQSKPIFTAKTPSSQITITLIASALNSHQSIAKNNAMRDKLILAINNYFTSQHVPIQQTSQTKQHFTFDKTHNKGQGYYNQNQVPEAQASIRILISHSIQRARTKTQQEGEEMMRKGSREVLTANYAIRMLKLRRLHYPIQYLIGEWPFKELKLTVKPPVLIPRFETEHLVEKAIIEIRKKWKKGSVVKFVDLGCGTGAIGLSLVKELQGQYEISGTLVDISSKCIDLATHNAVKNNIDLRKLTFLCEDMKNCSALIEASQVIISNPPYLTQNSHKRLQKQVRLYQSHSALVGGKDGLNYVNYLIGLISLQKGQGKDLLCLIQYGGEDVSHLSMQQNVRVDQYNRRRYIIIS